MRKSSSGGKGQAAGSLFAITTNRMPLSHALILMRPKIHMALVHFTTTPCTHRNFLLDGSRRRDTCRVILCSHAHTRESFTAQTAALRFCSQLWGHTLYLAARRKLMFMSMEDGYSVPALFNKTAGPMVSSSIAARMPPLQRVAHRVSAGQAQRGRTVLCTCLD